MDDIETQSSGSRKSGEGRCGGFSQFRSSIVFSNIFPHVRICHPSLSPRVQLDNNAFDYFMNRFIPLEIRFDSCVVKRNEKTMYFLVYELLSLVATFDKVKSEGATISIRFDDDDDYDGGKVDIADVSAYVHHEMQLSNESKTANGPVEFVTSYQRPSKPDGVITSVIEVKHKLISSESIFDSYENNEIYQFYAQLSVSVENNRLKGSFEDVWGAYTDGYTWIFACAKSKGADLMSGIDIELAEPLMFHMNHKATFNSKVVVEYLFSAIFPNLSGTITEEKMQASYSMFDSYIAGKITSFFDALEKQREQERTIERLHSTLAEKDSKLAEKDSILAEKEKEIAELRASLLRMGMI